MIAGGPRGLKLPWRFATKHAKCGDKSPRYRTKNGVHGIPPFAQNAKDGAPGDLIKFGEAFGEGHLDDAGGEVDFFDIGLGERDEDFTGDLW
jgi:hypothetical protein